MARFSFLTLIFFSLFVATNAITRLSSQQPVTNQDSVHTTQSWSWDDCGRSSCTHIPNPQLKLSFQGLPSDPIQIESISVSPDPPKPGQNLTVTVKASAQEEIEVRSQAPVSYTTH